MLWRRSFLAGSIEDGYKGSLNIAAIVLWKAGTSSLHSHLQQKLYIVLYQRHVEVKLQKTDSESKLGIETRYSWHLN